MTVACTGSARKSSVYNQLKIPRTLFGILRTPPFVNHSGKDVNSDWLEVIWRRVRIHRRKTKDDDPAISTAQNPKHLDGVLALSRENSEDFH